MKICILTIYFLFLVKQTFSMLKVVKNNESRKLVDTDDQENELFEPDEIIFHVSQDPITR